MRLQSVKFAEDEGRPQEWTLEGLSLGSRNLLVGKNASGKTRALNVVNGLSNYLAGIRPLGLSGSFDVVFTHEGSTLRYQLKYEDEQVATERFSVGDRIYLDRSTGGAGTIWADQIDGGKLIQFQTPPNQLAAVVRRDAIQHKYLEPLYEWASSVRLYSFGTSFGKDHFPVFVEKGGGKPNDRDPNAVVALYHQAEKDFRDTFKRTIMSDMGEIDYQIAEIGTMAPISIKVIASNLPGELTGLYVREKGLPGVTDQHSMSQGMFRTLAVLIHVNYSLMAKKSTCILIDDIGEGLDFDRSCRLIDLLRRKANEFNLQLIMSTNDRFVMNRVPLEEWSVLQRLANHVRVRNYENSKEVFEEFKFTGLSNFSFLEMDFISGPPPEEPAEHE